MKYALNNGKKIEATKNIKGICPNCGSELIAKCGNIKINHWAHKRIKTCDPWWETETEWHRFWKNNYPNEWQEVSLKDETTGEKHIADIRTDKNLFIEFQHSHIDPNERTKREMFYKNMIWVVDGTRLKRDYPRFSKARKGFLKTEKKGIFLVDYPDEVFPINWLNSKVPVIFDFKGLENTQDNDDKRNNLYCLFQVRFDRYSILAEINRGTFIKSTINGEWSFRFQNFINSLNQIKEIISKQKLKVQTKLIDKSRYYDPKTGLYFRRRGFR